MRARYVHRDWGVPFVGGPSAGHRVAVVVVLFNSAEVLPGLAASLDAGLEGVDARVLFVDNDSSDNSREVAQRLVPGAAVVATGRNGGYAAGINAGAAAAGGFTALLVLNPDVRLDRGSVATLLAALETPGTGITVPRLTNGDGTLIPSMRREPTLLRLMADTVLGGTRAGRLGSLGEVVTDERRYLASTVTDWAEGSTQLISRACWDACGPWDESFFMYSEETDFGLRARDVNFATRLVPQAHAVHLEGGSAVSPPLWALVARNRSMLYRRRHGRLLGAAYHAVLVAREGSRALLGRPTSRAAFRELLRTVVVRDEPSPAVIARYRRG